MGLKDSIRDWREQRLQRKANQAFAVIAPVIQRATASRWQFFVSSLSPEVREFFELKWRLFPDWEPGNGPPRPRSVAEMVELLAVDASRVWELDWLLVDHARNIHRRYDPAMQRFPAVPIDVAPEWWDGAWAWMYNPDGSEKPREEWGPDSSAVHDSERLKQVHEVQDERELRLHLVRDHGLEYVKEHGGPSYSFDHRKDHLEEDENGEWDRRLRGIEPSPR